MAGQANGEETLKVAPREGRPLARSGVGPKGRLAVAAIIAGSAAAGLALLVVGLGQDGWARFVLATLAASLVVSTVVGTLLVTGWLPGRAGPGPQPSTMPTPRATPPSGAVRQTPDAG